MPPFQVQFLQMLRNAGLAVYSEAPSKEVDGIGPRVTAISGDHRLFLYGAKDKWIVESDYSCEDGNYPDNFKMQFDTPAAAVANAIAYFNKDARWISANNYLEAKKKKP